MIRLRLALVGVGVLVGMYGAYLLLSREPDWSRTLNVAEWLIAAIVLHDFVLSPFVLGFLVLSGRIVPRRFRAPAVVGLIVLGTSTIYAIPVLSGKGVRPDNATLDDRNYTVGWLVLAALVLLAVVVAGVIRSRRAAAHG